MRRARNSVPRFAAKWMHRKAEEDAASGANGDDENAARRRLGAGIGSEFVARRTTSVHATRVARTNPEPASSIGRSTSEGVP